MLQHASFRVQQKPRLLVHVGGEGELWLHEARPRRLVVLRGSKHGVEEEEDRSEQDGELEAAGHPRGRLALTERDDFDLEGESRVWRYRAASPVYAVGVIRWASKYGLLSLPELADALVPAADDSANTDLELEGLTSLHTRVEDLSILQLASVVDFDECAFRHEWS